LSSEEQRREPGENQAPAEPGTENEAVEEPSGAPEDPVVEEFDEEDNPPDGTLPDDIVDGEVVEDENAPESDAAVSEPEAAEASREELEAALKERDQAREDLMYLRAEFDNVRKRQERELERIVRNASENLVCELLPVLDNLERALEVEGDVRDGVRATLEQFGSVLGGQGLTPVPSDGQPFDPNIHEAVMSQPSEEHEENTVLQTFERGYTLNGKPIRTAKVVVAI
jgi:molecular chaperone GrpE